MGGPLGVHLAAVQLARQADREVADVDDFLDLAAGLAQDLAVFEADEPRQVFFARPERLTEPADDLAATRRGYLAPRTECLLGGADSLVVLGLAGRTDACQQTPRGWIERVDGRTATLQELAASGDAADGRGRLEAKRGQDLGDA